MIFGAGQVAKQVLVFERNYPTGQVKQLVGLFEHVRQFGLQERHSLRASFVTKELLGQLQDFVLESKL